MGLGQDYQLEVAVGWLLVIQYMSGNFLARIAGKKV